MPRLAGTDPIVAACRRRILGAVCGAEIVLQTLHGPTGAEGAAGTGQAAGGAGGSDVLPSGAGGTGSGLVAAALKINIVLTS